jgi:capsular exopolysaccharide synthesis family protein
LKQPVQIADTNNSIEGIDFEKLGAVFKKNLFWVILLFILCNLTAYLFIRYTKDVFESESELKLDIKSNATEFGIKNVIEDQNLNIVSGEIEQIKSKLFIGQLIDTLDLSVSYYSLGKVLRDEMYKRSPYLVHHQQIDKSHINQPINIDFLSSDQFQLKFGEKKVNGKWGTPVRFDKTELTLTKTQLFDENDGNKYFFILNSRDRLIDYISKNLEVEPLNYNANTIRIAFKDNNATKAYDIVNNVDSLYIIYSNQQKNLANTQKIEWLNKELVSIEKRIDNYDSYFEDFTVQNKSSDMGVELKQTISFINKTDSQRFSLNKRIIELNNIIDNLQSESSISNIFYINGLPERLNENILKLQTLLQEKNKLALSYNENTFAYKQKEQEYKTEQNILFSQLTNLKKELLSTLAELNQRKEKLEKDFIRMPNKNTEYLKNQRFYTLYEEFYLSLMQSKAQFEIAQAGTTPDFRILSHATLPLAPILPKKNLILAIGFVSGIVINIFFIGLLYLINNKIISLKELENGTQVPILGTIPISNHVSETIFHVIDNPKSIVSEAIRTIRTNLEFFSAGTVNKVISISSTISGEGKSFLAVNLGGVIALSRKKVVLVDLDMRKSKNEKYPAGSDSNKGMSTILIKKNYWKECLIHTSLENFDFIPSGPHPPNPSELLSNEEFTEFIEDLKKHYDFIVIDTPPVGLVTDGIMAMKQSDISIYVFRTNYSNKDYMHSLRRIVTLNKLKNVSAVLNAVPMKPVGYGYGYYEDRTPIERRWSKIFRKS